MDVESLLEQYRQGATKEFDILTNKLKDPLLDGEQLKAILQSLKKCVALLGHDVEILVGVLLQMDWASKDNSVIHEYQTLILNIVSAQPSYLSTMLRSLIRQFIPGKVFANLGPDSCDEKARAKLDIVFTQVHTVLSAVAKIAPMTTTLLPPLLSELFPYVGGEPFVLQSYVRNLLQIVDYLPRLRRAILELVIDRLIKIDVRASRESIQKAENDADEGEIFDMDTETTVTVQPASAMAHPDAQRLDVLMDHILSFIKKTCYLNDEIDWESTKALYKDLLFIFERTILPTHQSCHVQFVMFYICSFRLVLAEGFIDYLLKKVQDPNVQPLFRQAAAAYLASFLARATYVHTNLFKRTLDVMTQWLKRYIKYAAQSDAPMDAAHHAPFYAMCQGLFYVIIFRHRELLQTADDLRECENLHLQRIVSCSLNPLKFCMPVIVNTFASVARQYQLVQCDTIIEKNKRSWLPVSSSSCDKPAGQATIISYFPFDPYLLHRSESFICHIFREYDGSLVQESMEQEVADEEPEFTDANTEDQSFIKDLSFGKSPTDFFTSALSPGFKALRD